MSLVRQEEITIPGVIALPGSVISTFGAYPRRDGVRYVEMVYLYVQAAATTPMQVVLVRAIADVGNLADLIVNFSATGSVPSGVSAYRPCQAVPLNLVGARVPRLLVLRNKTVNTDVTFTVGWRDVEAP